MIRYINSEGKEYKFYDARVRATSGNFHKHAWTPETSKRKIGETVQGFEKDAAEYEITFTVRGALEDRKTFLDEMQDAFETDVLLEKPGRIYFGDSDGKCWLENNVCSNMYSITFTWSKYLLCKGICLYM